MITAGSRRTMIGRSLGGNVASIVSALIAAAVASLVAVLGHWQWRRQQASAAAQRYRAERASALKELWEKLNDHSTATRLARLDAEEFYRNVQDLNVFLIRRSPFLTDAEKELARLYLESIYAFRVRVEKSRDRAAREAMVTTGRLDRVGKLMGAVEAGQDVQRLEDALAAHVRDAMSGREPDLDIGRIRSELSTGPGAGADTGG